MVPYPTWEWYAICIIRLLSYFLFPISHFLLVYNNWNWMIVPPCEQLWYDSIGSLGKDNSSGIVTKVVLDSAFLRGTTNGLRIKTWQVIILFHVEKSSIWWTDENSYSVSLGVLKKILKMGFQFSIHPKSRTTSTPFVSAWSCECCQQYMCTGHGTYIIFSRFSAKNVFFFFMDSCS